ncbi:Hypothetical predicted protein [Cloeon dipterum]|uniref:F-box domain-containing protein n=1 Tax=Cloeon dipterum TaxID=197152 RepID=A0A8S1CMK6_9INSE|nr:Hypothetical predicted protein [Cloeon dipterum]
MAEFVMEKDDEARFVELTKVRLGALKMKRSLEEVAVRHVAENIHLFSEQNQLELLPIQVREKILQRVLQFGCSGSIDGKPERFQMVLKALPQLLSSRTRKVNLDGFFSFRPENSAVIQVFGWIARLAPNLEELSLTSVVASIRGVQSLLQPLSKMKKLRKMLLKVLNFRFSDLSKLCGDLPSLQVASVGALWHVEHDLRDGGEHERNLQNLRVLEDNQWCLHHRALLATAAPHLDYIAAWYWDFLPLPSDEKETPPFLKRRFLTLEARGIPEVGLELPLEYPNITHLVIDRAYFDVHSFEPVLHFKKVEALTFDGVRCLVIVERLLAAFGRQLRSLSILCVHPRIGLTFERISLLCPKLEKLNLRNVIVLDNSKEVFPELTELTWVNREVILSAAGILCAPKLRKVEMKGVFSLSDLENISKLIEKGDALRELRCLSLDLEHTYNPEFNLEHFNAAARMVKTASAFLPKLVNLHFALEIEFIMYEFDGEESVPIVEKFDSDTCDRLLKEYNKHNGVYPSD